MLHNRNMQQFRTQNQSNCIKAQSKQVQGANHKTSLVNVTQTSHLTICCANKAQFRNHIKWAILCKRQIALHAKRFAIPWSTDRWNRIGSLGFPRNSQEHAMLSRVLPAKCAFTNANVVETTPCWNENRCKDNVAHQTNCLHQHAKDANS